MATVDLSFGTLGGGSLEESFQRALDTVSENLGDPDLVGQKRTITVTIEFQPKGDYVHTSTKVATKLPTKAGTGIAWVSGSKLVTESRAREGAGRQLDIVNEIGERRRASEGGND